jgi:hypothetical protein
MAPARAESLPVGYGRVKNAQAPTSRQANALWRIRDRGISGSRGHSQAAHLPASRPLTHLPARHYDGSPPFLKRKNREDILDFNADIPYIY